MSTSVFIARLIGPIMLVIGLAVFADQRGFRVMSEEFLASRALIFLSGMIIMPVGVAIVLTHNVWSADWRVLITIFGWLCTIGGAVRLFGLPFVTQAGHAVLRWPHFTLVSAAIWTVLGLLFCFFGYFH